MIDRVVSGLRMGQSVSCQLPTEAPVVRLSVPDINPDEGLAPNSSSRPTGSGIVHTIGMFAEQMVSPGLQARRADQAVSIEQLSYHPS